jgi:hypothetical protein
MFYHPSASTVVNSSSCCQSSRHKLLAGAVWQHVAKSRPFQCYRELQRTVTVKITEYIALGPAIAKVSPQLCGNFRKTSLNMVLNGFMNGPVWNCFLFSLFDGWATLSVTWKSFTSTHEPADHSACERRTLKSVARFSAVVTYNQMTQRVSRREATQLLRHIQACRQSIPTNPRPALANHCNQNREWLHGCARSPAGSRPQLLH